MKWKFLTTFFIVSTGRTSRSCLHKANKFSRELFSRICSRVTLKKKKSANFSYCIENLKYLFWCNNIKPLKTWCEQNTNQNTIFTHIMRFIILFIIPVAIFTNHYYNSKPYLYVAFSCVQNSWNCASTRGLPDFFSWLVMFLGKLEHFRDYT